MLNRIFEQQLEKDKALVEIITNMQEAINHLLNNQKIIVEIIEDQEREIIKLKMGLNK